MSAPVSPWMTPKDAAAYSRRNICTVWSALAAGELAGVQKTVPRGRWMTTQAAVDRWVLGLPAQRIKL